MRFFAIVVLFCYSVIIGVLSGFLVSFALHRIQPSDIITILQATGSDMQSRQILFAAGVLFIIIHIIFVTQIIGKWQRERTIAFKLASGVVTIALSAVEDLIRKASLLIPEIKDLKPNIIAGKKNNIEVNIRLTLKSETNIPELTSKLQDIIKSKMSELGIDAEISARIHVAKIAAHDEKKDRASEHGREQEKTPSVPFGGYRA